MKQHPPKGDARYRVHRSVKCYVAELACGTGGCTWYFADSIERVIRLVECRGEMVLYKGGFHPLKTKDEMKALVHTQLKAGGGLYIGGKSISNLESDNSYHPFPFIDISSFQELEQWRSWLRQNNVIVPKEA